VALMRFREIMQGGGRATTKSEPAPKPGRTTDGSVRPTSPIRDVARAYTRHLRRPTAGK